MLSSFDPNAPADVSIGEPIAVVDEASNRQ